MAVARTCASLAFHVGGVLTVGVAERDPAVDRAAFAVVAYELLLGHDWPTAVAAFADLALVAAAVAVAVVAVSGLCFDWGGDGECERGA